MLRNIRLKRLQWMDRVMSIKDERVPKKALKGYVAKIGRKKISRASWSS